MDAVLGRCDAQLIRGFLVEAGVFRTLAEKGFGELEVVVEAAGRALPHVLLYGRKQAARVLLLDACIGEATVRPDFFRTRGYRMEQPIEFVVVHWLREEDPTAAFSLKRPPLPLQEHPGLGVLRRAFRAIVRLATELDKDAVASVPKFFHDAVIFFRSRLFLFLDGDEQGRFEALARDLSPLPLSQASLALVNGCVRDAHGAVAQWAPGYQVCPLSAALTAYFHAAEYAARVSAALNQYRFTVDRDERRAG